MDIPASPLPQADENSSSGKKIIELEIFYYIFNAVLDPIFVKDEDHCWVYLNDALCEFMGRQREELLGKSDFEFFPKEQAEVFWQKDNEAFLSGQEVINEEFFTDSAGVEHIISTKKSILIHPSSGTKYLVGVIRDFTNIRETEQQLKQALAQVEKLSNTDELTNLANRRQLQTISKLQLQIARRNGLDVLLMYIDMDNLKIVNDQFGHKEGDKAIIEVTDILRHTLRGSDVIARIGGDEFVVLLTGKSAASGKRTVERLKDAIEKRNAADTTNKYKLSVSIGLAFAHLRLRRRWKN